MTSIPIIRDPAGHDVVTDWSYVLAGFLVSTLFGVSPSHSQVATFHSEHVFALINYITPPYNGKIN